MTSIPMKVQYLHPRAQAPQYAHSGDAGLDIFSTVDLEIEPGSSALVSTGLAIELPEGTEAQIRPRSGLALHHQITLLNSPGTIDCGYRGEIGVILINHGRQVFRVQAGMKIAQMVVKPVLPVTVQVVERLDTPSERGSAGFGSSGL